MKKTKQSIANSLRWNGAIFDSEVGKKKISEKVIFKFSLGYFFYYKLLGMLELLKVVQG